MTSRYSDGTYLETNPSWHTEDSDWKAAKVAALIERHNLGPASVCEVGCGAGEILRVLSRMHPDGAFVGYDISPEAHALAVSRTAPGLSFRLGDANDDNERFDLMLLLDVVEHVPDPEGFLRALRGKADQVIVHIPLQLCVQAALRPDRLQRSRATLGHINFYNAELALATMADAGYEVVAATYTCPGIERPPGSLLARLAREPRKLMAAIDQPLAARLLGGFSLLILARPV